MYLELPGVRVHVSFLFAAFLALALHSGKALAFGAVFVSALLHECAHLALLLSYGCRGLTLTLLPGGARLGGWAPETLSYKQTLVCVLAGPAVNLALSGALFLLQKRAPSAVFSYAARVNLALGCVNLLPISFLDGGRALHCILALKRKSPAPFLAAGRIDVFVIVFLCVLTFVLTCKGFDTLFLAAFTAYCLLFKLSARHSSLDTRHA